MTVFYESPFITGVLEIAEGFKSFFAGIGTELAGSITITHSNINFEEFSWTRNRGEFYLRPCHTRDFK